MNWERKYDILTAVAALSFGVSLMVVGWVGVKTYQHLQTPSVAQPEPTRESPGRHEWISYDDGVLYHNPDCPCKSADQEK